MSETLQRFHQTLGTAGINLVGAVPARLAAEAQVRDSQASPLEPTGSLLVCATGGRAHWERLGVTDLAQEHPIEFGASRVMGAAAVELPTGRLLSESETQAFDLRGLAERAGLGRMSPYLQMLIHPEFGPWISIRGLVTTSLEVQQALLPSEFDPCGPCPRPCLDVCPVGAYSRTAPWDFDRCAAHRLLEHAPERPCADSCRSRLACVIGVEHAYSDDEFRHRHRASLPTIRRLQEGRLGSERSAD